MTPKEANSRLDRVHFSLRGDGVSPSEVNPLISGIHHRGYLPHIKREGVSYFVTFRLWDSLPKTVLVRFKLELADALRTEPSKGKNSNPSDARLELQRKVEKHLDQGLGSCHLRQPEVATVVAEALQHFHNQQYILHDWVVMPNHVHLSNSSSSQFHIKRNPAKSKKAVGTCGESNPKSNRSTVLAAGIV